MSQRLIRDDYEKFMDYNCLIPSRTIYFGSEWAGDDGYGESGVDFTSSAKIIKNLLYLDKKNNKTITIHYNSPGGDWDRGIAIYDVIRGIMSPVRIIGYGCVRSMGTVIMQACDERLLTPNCRFMVHHGSYGFMGTAEDALRNADELRWSNNRMIDIYMNRINEKNPEMKREDVYEACKHDVYMSGEKAVELGLADMVVGNE